MHSRQTVFQGELGDNRAVSAEQRRWHRDEAVHAFSRHLRERLVEILTCAHQHRNDLNPESLGGGLDGVQGRTRRGCRRHRHHAEPLHVRECLLHDLELLGHKIGHEHRYSGDVAAGARKAGHVTDSDRVGMSSEHDGDRAGRLSGGLGLGRRDREDDVDVQTDEVGRQLAQSLDRGRVAKDESDVLALDIAVVPQAGLQGFYAGYSAWEP